MASSGSHPSRDKLAAICREVTGDAAALRAFWAEMRTKNRQIATREDISEDFLADGLAEAVRLGLLDDILFRLLSRGLTSGETFKAAAGDALGHELAGTHEMTLADAPDGAKDSLEMEARIADAIAALPEEPEEGFDPAAYQPFMPKDAAATIRGKDLAMDRICRIAIDGVSHGSGVLIADSLIATSAHVVRDLVEADPQGGGYRAKPGSLQRLSVLFPRAVAQGSEQPAFLAPDWLAFYSPPSEGELKPNFDLYDVTGLEETGPWDIALLRIAQRLAHLREDGESLSQDIPEFRFKMNVLHCAGMTTSPKAIWEAEGAYLGRLPSDKRLRLFHNAVTIPGCSGAGIFNSSWRIVAIHQGGALDPKSEGKGKINRAIPIGPWVKPFIQGGPPIQWQKSVPALDGMPPQPVIGRRNLQRRLHRAAGRNARREERLIVVRGGPGRGKSFSLRLLGAYRARGHRIAALDLAGAAGSDEAAFGTRLLAALGEPPIPGAGKSAVLDRLREIARDRPVWLAFDGFRAAGLIEGGGVGQFIDGLVIELERLPQLRLVLADWTRPLPPGFSAALEDLDQHEEWPRIDDFVDYIELLRMPPGEGFSLDTRDVVRDLLRPYLDPILKHAADPSRISYAKLIEAAQPLFERLLKPGEAWEKRSGAEREACGKELEAIGSAPPVGDEGVLDQIRARGALSGAVEPLELASASADDPHALLGCIAGSFDRMKSPEGWRWQMRPGPRCSVLRQLRERGALSEALADAETVETDAAGRWLRQMLRAETGQPSHATTDDDVDRKSDLEARLQAMNWLNAAHVAGAIDLHWLEGARVEAQRELATLTQQRRYDRLLEGSSRGYEEQLRLLHDFIFHDESGELVPLLPLEAVSGAGKSTFVAYLLQSQLAAAEKSGEKAIAVHIDFDRLAFRHGGELELSFDVTRQIAPQLPAVDLPLRELRDRTRDTLARLGEESREGPAFVETLIRSAEWFEREAGKLLAVAGAAKLPVLLFVEAFPALGRDRDEESQPSEHQRRLIEWISALKDRMGLERLRVIVDGTVPAEPFEGAVDVRTVLKLAGIGREEAMALLAKEEVGAEEAARLLELIGDTDGLWIPLTLRVAGRMMKGLGPEARARFFEGEPRLGGDLPDDEEMRQALLYKRYLERTTEADVATLAIPGLALRRVTLPLLTRVLAPACGLEIGEARARRLFDELDRTVWLGRGEGDAIVHRPGLRSVMLRLLRGDEQYRDRLKAVHEAAREWYRGADADLSADAARQEALYHDLALLAPDSDLPAFVEGVEPGSQMHCDLGALLPARDDFPPRLRSQMRFAVQDWVPPGEIDNLPSGALPSWAREHGRKLVRRGETPEALAFYEQQGGEEPHWLAQAQVDSLRWADRLASSEASYVSTLRQRSRPKQMPALPLELRLSHHVLRAFLAHDEGALGCILLIVARAARLQADKPSQSNPTALIDTLFFLLAALGRETVRRRAPALPEYLIALASHAAPARKTFEDWLRAAVVAEAFELAEEAAAALREASPQVVVAGMLRPDPGFLGAYKDYLQRSGLDFALPPVERYERGLAEPFDLSDLTFGGPAEAVKSLDLGDPKLAKKLLRLPDLVELMHAGHGELRPAVRTALARADGDGLPAELLRFLPSSANDPRRPVRSRIALIELLDRTGRLGDGLTAAQGAAPEIATVSEAYSRWDAAVRNLYASLFEKQGD